VGYWLMKFVFIGPFLRLIWRPWTEGRENIPRHGAAILASNHLSFSDSFFLPVVLDRKVTFIAKAEGTWRWQVDYSGDNNNKGTSSACGVESFTIKNS